MVTYDLLYVFVIIVSPDMRSVCGLLSLHVVSTSLRIYELCMLMLHVLLLLLLLVMLAVIVLLFVVLPLLLALTFFVFFFWSW